ncbi:uncharacterized protein LOC134208687 [Armigeres subalbatus]|uniref:uncharacterized protein LOC134208687 n=1 Tax=Armigeres subalbatus TaxID=124917 RepID=UPI002ED0BAC7
MVMNHRSSRNLLIKNGKYSIQIITFWVFTNWSILACPSIRKPPVPDSDRSARATRYERKKQKEVVTALLEAFDKQQLSLDQKTDQPPTPVISPQSEPLLNSPELSHTDHAVQSRPKQLDFSTLPQCESDVPDYLNCAQSNMDVLFQAIEIAQTSGARFNSDQSTMLKCIDRIETPRELTSGLDDSGVVDVDDNSKSFSNNNCPSPTHAKVQRLECQVLRLKNQLVSKNQMVKMLRMRLTHLGE